MRKKVIINIEDKNFRALLFDERNHKKNILFKFIIEYLFTRYEKVNFVCKLSPFRHIFFIEYLFILCIFFFSYICMYVYYLHLLSQIVVNFKLYRRQWGQLNTWKYMKNVLKSKLKDFQQKLIHFQIPITVQ